MKFTCFIAIATALFLTPGIGRAQASPSAGAAAEELLKAMKMDEMMVKMQAQQKEAVARMMAGLVPKDATPEQLATVQAAQTKIFDRVMQEMSWPTLRPEFVRIYGEVFTESEMRDLAAFYSTPIGLKLQEKTPEISAKVMQVTQKRMMTLMPEIQKIATESQAAAKKTK